ncbi:hypothetical protein K437DRAFT_259826 [Tilletiaria anomala UBC 951]|uniref:REJ domain-containing protein n=1 Tax=Tilletiaria anomala (strain ATCC 24038 / CBS 436.72 / UBC 951) TaxID=1037660 RepID=A0A066VEY8_TILAU|nr:uncharacterized protein K437DRAFT_259826 [Tilletiaria anomala UBC 951]KDN37319.1 hypothetical protein K437DRAFT_259826 [Tilletiaria anomala UBC 951]
MLHSLIPRLLAALPALMLLLLSGAALPASAQSQQASSSPAPSGSFSATNSAVSGKTTSAAATFAPSSTFLSLTTSVNGSTTSVFNVTLTSSSTSKFTPTTLPTAAVITAGSLAGTASAPSPGGGVTAVGPNDSYVVSAAKAVMTPLGFTIFSSAASVALGSYLFL